MRSIKLKLMELSWDVGEKFFLQKGIDMEANKY